MHAPDSVIKFKIVQSFSLMLLVVFSINAFPANPSLAPTATQSLLAPVQTLLVLGDSLSAAYGIPLEQGWVALLEKQLLKTRKFKKVVNASISGETTDGGLRSLPGLLKKFTPSVVIIELGANDGLRGFPLNVIESNLARLVELAQQHQSKVLLVGMHIPPNYGKRYANAFHQLYLSIAEKYGVALLPFILEGIAVNPELMQTDKLHPKAEAQEAIRAMIWNRLEPLISDPVTQAD